MKAAIAKLKKSRSKKSKLKKLKGKMAAAREKYQRTRDEVMGHSHDDNSEYGGIYSHRGVGQSGPGNYQKNQTAGILPTGEDINKYYDQFA